MKLFNSLHNKVEAFKPMNENEVSMYVCGPTVYNYPHIGNARPIIVFDTLKKTFEALGYKVKFVSNFTDVDDKIIKKAIEMNVDEKTITEHFINAYNSDRQSLNADLPDVTPKVTETMDEIIDFIKLLVDKGFAYEIDGDVYFRVNKIDDYGQLSNQQIEDLMVGARIDENALKENPLDFTLWKKTEEGIKWDSPWSKGRPGWHSECVVMINNEFHQHQIDIHGGGMDLKFPHHENEIAQSEAAYGTHIANYWLHNGMVNIDGEKMSKSLGNVIWVKDIVEKLGGNVVRWLMLSAHYRAPLNLNDQAVETAQTELEKIKTSLKQAYVKLGLAGIELVGNPDETLWQAFLDAMSDDLNTPNAFKALFDTNKQLNAAVRTREIDYGRVAALVITIEKMLYVLGIKLDRIVLSDDDKDVFANWNQAKAEKNFEAADQYRAVLMERGLL
ncbi:cysteine--tRNA ligase [Dielma fastidiosa]|uniref:cysteine--tRNA ligase n=1 Tax=Dielma fastidiosa TaxID=1034346 RepID=UPI000D79E962|nr:cysteine--tRNA ligase [Dielma fastidiosa]MBS6166992.1 cysteine--tRNA ligase [Bacillota bacterium]PWM64257.1 MAG: cysteine--tRNA ligase [Dielma fastidiosa]